MYVTRDDTTGDVVLSNRPGAKTRNAFFELLHEIDVPADFMAERPLNALPEERGVLHAASWRADDVAHAGHRHGELDMMIAAHSLSADTVLVTKKLRYYQRIEAP